MENQSQTKQVNSWTASDKETLAKCLAVICNAQKAYGKEVNMRNIFDYFVMKLEHRYSVDAVLKAIDKYTDTKNDIPTPADIINTIDPPITYAQYKAAEIAQEKNGYPRFSYEAGVIKKYHTQQSQKTDESGKLLPSTEKPMIEDKRESKDDQYTPEKMQRVGNYVQQALDAIAENERLAMARKSASE